MHLVAIAELHTWSCKVSDQRGCGYPMIKWVTLESTGFGRIYDICKSVPQVYADLYATARPTGSFFI